MEEKILEMGENVKKSYKIKGKTAESGNIHQDDEGMENQIIFEYV